MTKRKERPAPRRPFFILDNEDAICLPITKSWRRKGKVLISWGKPNHFVWKIYWTHLKANGVPEINWQSFMCDENGVEVFPKLGMAASAVRRVQ